ncbi:uncharacterized protein [Haliotis asinina]|uniref:uncharacterized protein n=1 Tax=Haliotis asinina TaxID=109174 RepID=UPI00353229C3
MPWTAKRGARVGTTDNTEGDTGSLNSSQLNLAIRDMLQMNQARNQCEQFCRGDQARIAGKPRQLLKTISIVIIPVAVLTALIGNTFFHTFTRYVQSFGIRATLLYSVELGTVIHSLQEERDISALYLSSIEEKTKSLLLRRYPETDKSLEKLTFWTTGPTLVLPEFQSKDKFLSYLNRHRYELDTLNQSVTMELEMYTSLISVFISWLYDAVTEDHSGAIWRSLVAYQEVIVAKEYMGLERALGTVFYATGRFPSREAHLWFSESQDVTNATFLSARRYSGLVHALYEKNIHGNEMLLDVLGRMRAEIRRNDLKGKGSVKMAQWWFNNMTMYMDLLLTTQTDLSEEITQIMDEGQIYTFNRVMGISFVLACVFILCPVIIYTMYSLTNELQQYSTTLTQRARALDKEQKRTEMLFYQMIPKSVAEKMKQNEIVGAEHYSEATILFSDIQGFTLITARSSPLQVVNMLNSLYLCFNERIDKYDVYTVETIGDAYMIVSGIPNRNDHSHAAEIGKMALDIMGNVSQLEIPHLPGTKFKLRVGCHTGPCLAAVVGPTMPRYCLFGNTISIGAKMESLGKRSMIHISPTTHDALHLTGGFVTVEREDRVAKDDWQLKTAFGGRIKTYWLTGHEDIQPISRRSDSLSDLSDKDCHNDDGDEVARGKTADILGGTSITSANMFWLKQEYCESTAS